MDWLEIVAIIFSVVGLLGCILPALPGPPLSYIGLICIYFANRNGAGEGIEMSTLVTWGCITIGITVLDYIVPALLTKMTGGHKEAATGAMIGMIAGIFFTPIGMITGSLLGALVGELLVAKSDIWTAIKAAIGTFIGFLIGTIGKLICCGFMLYELIKHL